MSEKIFDTHEYVKDLLAAGFTEAQAEAIRRKQAELIDTHLATKRDLRELENRLLLKLGGCIGIVALLMKVLS